VTTLRPGEIYWAFISGEGRHRVIVVSAERFNRGGRAIVVLVTSRHFELRRRLFNCVPLRAGECGMKRDCVAQCENIFPIKASELDLESGPIDRLDGEKMREVIRAIGYVIEADCEPAPHDNT